MGGGESSLLYTACTCVNPPPLALWALFTLSNVLSIIVSVALMWSKMAVLTRGFNEASVARILLSLCIFGTCHTKPLSGGIRARSKLFRRAANSAVALHN